MKRLHVHVAVGNLVDAIAFYSTLFAAKPSIEKADYAKWMLDDPRVNFAISARGRAPGLNHLGIQVENDGELHEVYERLKVANRPVAEQGKVACCYHKSEKAWIEDPAGISWETFLTTGESSVYGDGTGETPGQARIAPGPSAEQKDETASACCSA